MATTYQRPGVYVSELAQAQQIPPAAVDEAVGAFIGYSLRGPETPYYVTSWSVFVKRFGGFNGADPKVNRLATAVYMFFANGGRAAWVQRDVGGSSVVATTALTDGTTAVLTVDAIDKGTWANSSNNGLFVQVSNVRGTGSAGAAQNGDLFDLTIFYGTPQTTLDNSYIVEKWTDLSMDPSKSRYIDIVNASSQWVKLTATNASTSKKPPQATTGTPAVATLASGTDGTSTAATLLALTTKFDTIKQNLIFCIPGAFDLDATAPGTSAASVYSAFIDYSAARGDCFVVVDVPAVCESTSTLALTFTGTTLAKDSAYAAAYYPSVKIANPAPGASGSLISSPVGALVTGKYMDMDATRGTQKAPAGISVSLVGVVDTTYVLTATDLDSINSAAKPINAIRFVPGAGMCVMGARTLSSNLAYRYVPTRRTALRIKKNLNNLLEFAVFENNDANLRNRVRTIVNAYLQGLYQEGALKGGIPAQAYFVKCDSANNPSSSITAGNLVVEVGVSLQTPAEFVIIRIGQFDGSTSVTETV
ncbi:MAG: phage tail sheath family protein [Microbacteriaceae bacterium]|nr:phage tail sheath family protein [Microbacteriaceae bacterium]